MSTALTVKELRVRYGDECAHTDQVARLAGVLFDRTRSALGIAREDKRLLTAACLLHDVGYRLDPSNHAWMSAQLVLTRGLGEYTEEERSLIAGAIMLHQRKYEYALATPFIQRLPDRRRALRLAAYLRVADGLDHSHIQDAAIGSVRRGHEAFVVRVRPCWYEGNVPRAEVKADLWRKVFAVGIELQGGERTGKKPLFAGVVEPEASVLENARRLLSALYRTIVDTREMVLLADDPEALHDLRVGVRRFRAALRFYKPLPAHKRSVERLDAYLSQLLQGLGPARDADVWCGYLRREKLVEAMEDKPGWEAFVTREGERRERKAAKLKELLRGEEWSGAATACSWLVRVLLPQCIRDVGDATPIRLHAAARVGTELETILKKGRVVTQTEDDEKLHDLRRAVRRGRYWTEFSHPLATDTFGELHRRLRAVTHALGEVHDMAVIIRRIGKSRVAAPPGLSDIVHKRRKRWIRTFRREWAALSDETFRCAMERKLADVSKGR
jgi:CHAD domain-containing protein